MILLGGEAAREIPANVDCSVVLVVADILEILETDVRA